MDDFYSRLSPWTKSGVFGPQVLGVGGTFNIVAAAPSGFSRWVLGCAINDVTFAGGVALLETQGGSAQFHFGGYLSVSWGVLNRLLTNSADTALRIRALVAGSYVVSVAYADAPQNIFSNLVLGSVAG